MLGYLGVKQDKQYLSRVNFYELLFASESHVPSYNLVNEHFASVSSYDIYTNVYNTHGNTEQFYTVQQYSL